MLAAQAARAALVATHEAEKAALLAAQADELKNIEAKVAAKLAVGYTLDELLNDITGGATPASFEPSIDYIVTKIPRFTFEKFPQTDNFLTTQMKSVGEVMAIGRTFKESFHKAIRSLEVGHAGLEAPDLAEGAEGVAGRAQEWHAGGGDPIRVVRILG